MQKLIAALILAGGVLLFPNVSKADGVHATATYSDNSKHTGFSAPGATISFSFNLPSVLNSSLEDLNIPVNVSFNGKSITENSDIYLFAGPSDGGLFDLDFTDHHHLYEFVFFGGQLFNSSDQLIPGSYPLGMFEGSDSLLYKDNGDNPSGIFTSGTVIVSKATSVPEPASLLLLGLGLFGLVLASRGRFVKA